MSMEEGYFQVVCHIACVMAGLNHLTMQRLVKATLNEIGEKV